MNEEKKIAQAILDAQKLYEKSYCIASTRRDAYSLGFEECFKKACENNGLSSNLWALLSLANYWSNDIEEWAEAILRG